MKAIRRIVLAVLSIASTAFASDVTIFDARKSLSLSDSEPSYRDFYLNGGSDAGLKAGMIFSVIRKLPLYDTYENRSPGDLVIRVGKIKIIHVQKSISVARLHSMLTRDNLPLLEDNFIMVGDKLDLGSAEGDKKAEASDAKPAPVEAEPAAKAPAPEPTAAVEPNKIEKQAQSFAIDFASKTPVQEVPPVPVPTVQ